MASEGIKITVPNQKIDGFKRLAHSDKRLVEKIKNELQSQDLIICAIDELVKKIAEKNSLNLNEVSSVISTIADWVLVHRRMDLTSEEFMEGVTAFLEGQSEDI